MALRGVRVQTRHVTGHGYGGVEVEVAAVGASCVDGCDTLIDLWIFVH